MTMVQLNLCVSSGILYAIHYILCMQAIDLLQNPLIRASALRTHVNEACDKGQDVIMQVVADNLLSEIMEENTWTLASCMYW